MRIVGEPLEMQRLGHGQGDRVARRPGARELDVRAGRRDRRRGDSLAIHRHGEAVSGPFGTPHSDRQGLVGAASVSVSFAVASPSGKLVSIVSFTPFGAPLRRRRRVDVHPQLVERLVVQPVAMQRVVLHACADAAGETPLPRGVGQHVLILAPHTLSDRNHVAGAAVFRVDRSEHVVEQRALLELRILIVRPHGKQVARELQHVVDVAALGGAAVDDVAQVVGFAEILVLAVAAGGKRMVLGGAIPEKRRGETVVQITRVDEARQRADRLRDRGVPVQASSSRPRALSTGRRRRGTRSGTRDRASAGRPCRRRDRRALRSCRRTPSPASSASAHRRASTESTRPTQRTLISMSSAVLLPV